MYGAKNLFAHGFTIRSQLLQSELSSSKYKLFYNIYFQVKNITRRAVVFVLLGKYGKRSYVKIIKLYTLYLQAKITHVTGHVTL